MTSTTDQSIEIPGDRGMLISEVPADNVIPLRSSMLRPDRPIEESHYSMTKWPCEARPLRPLC